MQPVLLTALLFLLIESCAYDNADVQLKTNCETVSYKSEINTIIQSRCAYSGCHITGFQQGNFTSYDSLKIKIDNGSFRLRVFEMKSMPPLTSLSEEEFKKIECWFNAGAKNN
jgi:hypothetical protein